MRNWRFVWLGLGLAALISVVPSHWAAAQISDQPVLRLETGGHIGMINRIAVDRTQRLVASASNDKTLRLWLADTGELVRTLRVPIGPGNEGALYGVAFSPDGRLVATGGWTCEGQETWCLYLFDVATGRLIRRIDGLSHRALYLAFSHDGRYLAATMKAGNGLIVFDTADYGVVKLDSHYGTADAPWVEFAPDGRLLTVSRDGNLRLYTAKTFELRHTKSMLVQADPVCATFSPDGQRIAVGFDHDPTVNVLSGLDLAPLFAADTRGVSGEGFNRLAWSADGTKLYGGGGYARIGRNLIRRWPEGGRGRPTDIAASREFVTHLVALDSGRLVFATNEPSIATLDDLKPNASPVPRALADFRELGDSFRISPDGLTVDFALEPWAGSKRRFSLPSRLLSAEPAIDPSLAPPIKDVPGIDIRLWEGAEPPEIDGRPLDLNKHEEPISYAFDSAGERVFIGTWWRLYQFDRAARRILDVPSLSKILALNLTPDGRILVAALGDGTIRWYRAKDCVELAALFVHVDGVRWVMWTPSGYYAASPGGDGLVGWHVNNGPAQAADYFGVARFRAHYYRPDIVEATIRLADEAAAISSRGGGSEDIARLVPPVITIDGIADGAEMATPRLTLPVTIRAAMGSTVNRIDIRADGRPIVSLEGRIELDVDGETQLKLPVTLPRRDLVLSVVAETARGIPSEPASVRIRWRGVDAPRLPDLYLVAVGVSRYAQTKLNLGFAAKDARDLAATLSAQAGRAFGAVKVVTLLDEQATRPALDQALAWLRGSVRQGDVAALFLAGHGVDDAAGEFRFFLHEADLAHLDETTLPYRAIRDVLGNSPAQALLFIDACHAGAARDRSERAPTDVNRLVNDLASVERGVVVFASSTGDQLSGESATWGNGAFTKALVEGLEGRADLFGEGDVTITTLDAFVSRRVARLTEGRQTPATGKPIGADLLLARAKTEITP